MIPVAVSIIVSLVILSAMGFFLRRLTIRLKDSESSVKELNGELERSHARSEELIRIIQVWARDKSAMFHADLSTERYEMYCQNSADDNASLKKLADSTPVFSELMKTFIEREVHPGDQAELLQAVALMKEKLAVTNTFSLAFRRHFDGGYYFMEMRCARESDVNPDKVIVIFRNVDNKVTNEKRQKIELIDAQKKAEEANRAKTAFLFSVGHDLRIPMNAIQGFSALALRHIDDRERVKDYLTKIELSGNHLLELIDNIIELSRVEAGKLHNDIRPMNLMNEIMTVLADIRELAAKHGVELSFSNHGVRNSLVYADNSHVCQVLEHVLNNAVKYTPAGGSVMLTVSEQPSNIPGHIQYVFMIEDTGVGMSETFQEHAFDSFTREFNSKLGEVEGTGLGLAVVKRLVDFMGGTISIESRQNVGTSVTIHLTFRMLEPMSGSHPQVKEVSTESLKGKRVLLVEDNDLNREIVHEMLVDEGVLVEEVVNGKEAVEAVKNHEFGYYNYVLMDIQMPLMNGYEATEKIRGMEQGRQLPIIALSANTFEEDRHKSMEAGMNAHLSKPVQVKDLLDTLRAHAI